MGSRSSCSVATFEDVTALKFPKADPYWHQWRHVGRPYLHEGYPLFIDINDDGVLDYFSSMHGHPIDDSCGFCERMELGESVPYDFSLDNVIVGDSTAYHRNGDGNRFRRTSYRIINDEPELRHMDPHGRNVLDLDGDGFDDILIASGGGMGQPLHGSNAETRDNFLFWGEEGIDNITGLKTTFFRGGRHMARKAGVHMRLGRGRTNYILDANGDGLLDIFMLADRRGDNELTPGVLLVNQGNRTWEADESMSEFARTMILTDTDGDGVMNEIVIDRSFCFPQRGQPGSRVKYFGPKMKETQLTELGPFPEKVIDFCASRPVGTTAIFRFNKDHNCADEVSPLYHNVSIDDDKQPPCCPHGTWDTADDCHAKSFASGDLDGDLKADLLVSFARQQQSDSAKKTIYLHAILKTWLVLFCFVI